MNKKKGPGPILQYGIATQTRNDTRLRLPSYARNINEVRLPRDAFNDTKRWYKKGPGPFYWYKDQYSFICTRLPRHSAPRNDI